MLREKCIGLLALWCEKLLSLQYRNTGKKELDGGIFCPQCGIIHGRCFDAIYPFLTMASITSDPKWEEGAENLFSWAENNVSLPDGLYLNDIGSDWKGTTVFSVIGLCDSYLHYGKYLRKEFADRIYERIRRAGEALLSFDELKRNNINYAVSNALALFECWLVIGEERYRKGSLEFLAASEKAMLPDGMIIGEGIPWHKKSERGNYPVDIGYNAEESVPAITKLALLSGDDDLLQKAVTSMRMLLSFMLPDGAWDNSFGTRSFKWSYWGSRTADGAFEALLGLSDYNPSFIEAAERNIDLMAASTSSGLLMGGMMYQDAGEESCVHHTFTHAKPLAAVVHSGKDYESVHIGLPREKEYGIRCFDTLSTCIASYQGYTVTITAYDWKYLERGHVSGGMISMLYGMNPGPVIASGMMDYRIVEAFNMQLPSDGQILENMAFRIEKEREGTLYSSVYETRAEMDIGNDEIAVSGMFKSVAEETCPDDGKYSIHYSFFPGHFSVLVRAKGAKVIIPVIASESDDIECLSQSMRKNGLIISALSILYPYGDKRIFAPVPGFQAVRLDIPADNALIDFRFD